MSALHRCLALGLCLTTGCSFTFVETVPDNPHQLRYFDCTSTPGLPVADGVIALSNVVSAVTVFTQSKEEFEAENEDASRDLVGGVSIGVAAIMAASGIYGLIQTENCRAAKSELRERLLSPQRDQRKLLPSPTAPPTPPSSPEQAPAVTPAPQPPAATTPAPSDIQRLPVPQTPPQPTLVEPAPEVNTPPASPAPAPPAQ